MAYFIELFSPETYEAFARSSRDVSGFRLRHKRMAERVSPGDIFVCYPTRLSRWFGLLEVIEGPCIDDQPIFLPESEPSGHDRDARVQGVGQPHSIGEAPEQRS